MPNFVMVDFLNDERGRYIKSLDNVAATQLTQQVVRQQALDQAVGQIDG